MNGLLSSTALVPGFVVDLWDPSDIHIHLRGLELAHFVLRYSSRYTSYLLAMPNVPPLLTGEETMAYNNPIQAMIEKLGHTSKMIPCMMLDDTTTPAMIYEAAKLGVRAAKLYPKGVTTGDKHKGVSDIRRMLDVFKAMRDCGMVLCLHGETPSIFCLDRESDFIRNTLYWLVGAVEGLTIVLEHITTEEAVNAILALPDNVYATITAHHLYDTLDVVIGDMLRPHAYCKPSHKYPGDRAALRKAAASRSKKFGYGSDTAPHGQHTKECASGCAGAYTAEDGFEMAAEAIEEEVPHDQLQPVYQNFFCDVPRSIYGLEPQGKHVQLVRRPHIIGASTPFGKGLVIPYRAGHTLQWSMQLPN